jgi:hypothetical protein
MFSFLRKWLSAVQLIYMEPNNIRRRQKIAKYGEGRFVTEFHRTKLLDECQHSAIPGLVGARLLKVEFRDDDPLVMVDVINPTPEPDGTRKRYQIRVDPLLRPLYANGDRGRPQAMTVRNAVASTWGKYGHEYFPDVET